MTNNVGKGILSSLTTGMYDKSIVIFREYVQNACDQIDKAVELGILVDRKEGLVDIDIDSEKRQITISDNATGIAADLFRSTLGDIANSDKKVGVDKGFRGIGRLCGLAYCRELRFETSTVGESKKSIMICNASKMREMLEDEKKYTLAEVWDSIITYEEEQENEDAHYFKVTLIDVNKENSDLLNKTNVTEYLEFVAPVPYINNFYRRTEIYKYAKEHNHRIDEYRVRVDGKIILKPYNVKIYDANNNVVDEILRIEFREFINGDGEELGWGWIGVPACKGAIKPINRMYCIRARCGNIQIGDETFFKEMFREERGTKYFIGEIFATNKRLIPTSQRSNYNENTTRIEFEALLRDFFLDLHTWYNKASKLSSAYREITKLNRLVDEYEKKEKENDFVNIEQKNSAEEEIIKAKEKANKAKKLISSYQNLPNDNPLSDIYDVLQRANDEDFKRVKEEEKTSFKEEKTNKGDYITNTMSGLSRKERKVVERVLDIVIKNAPRDIAELITAKVKEEFK